MQKQQQELPTRLLEEIKIKCWALWLTNEIQFPWRMRFYTSSCSRKWRQKTCDLLQNNSVLNIQLHHRWPLTLSVDMKYFYIFFTGASTSIGSASQLSCTQHCSPFQVHIPFYSVHQFGSDISFSSRKYPHVICVCIFATTAVNFVCNFEFLNFGYYRK